MTVANLKKTGLHFFCILLIAFLPYLNADAQAPQLVKLTPPSPNVAAFQKYGDIPISAYTGIPNISVPIYTVKFRDISVPISLSYHASGIKVSEEAGQVGLGWTLNAGGNISRNIMGLDDFNGSVYFNGPLNNVFDLSGKKGPTNYTVHKCSLPVFDNSPGSTNTLFNVDLTNYLLAPQSYDFQPDQYYYNFGTKSGKFMLNRLKQAIIEKQESVAFSLVNNGAAWRVVSEDGYIYDFSATETYSDDIAPGIHNSAWHLTQITSPAGNTVTFHYIPNDVLVNSIGSYSESRDDYDVGTMGSASLGSTKGFTPGKNYSNLILDYIDFTIGKVVFKYSGNRTDLAGEKKLDSISVYNAGETTPIKTYSLVYDYFHGESDPSFNNVGATVSTFVSQRLKLTQLIEKGYYNGQTVQNPPYIFSYNEGSTNPAKTSFARDHWGYFNGVTGKVTLIPSTIPVNSTNLLASQLGTMGSERDPDSYYAGVFNISSIKYPTGGWTEFQFESNDFDEKKSQVNDHSYFNMQNDFTVLKTQPVGYDAVNKRYLGTNIIDLTNEYVLPASQGGGSPAVTISASFRFPGTPGNYCGDVGLGPNQVYFELKDINGNLISHIDPGGMTVCSNNPTPTCVICQMHSPVFTYTTTYQLPPGKYSWTAFVGTSGAALKLEDMNTIFNWYELSSQTATNSNSTNTISTGGGLRIKRIIDHDGISENNNKVKKYDYHYMARGTGADSTTHEYSYGRRMSKPQYSYFTISVDDNSQNASGCVNNVYFSYHLMRTSDSNIPLNGSASGAVVGYDQVTELLGENGEYGKTVYKYINEPDIVSSYTEDFYAGLPMRPPYGSNIANPLNGSLLHETQYANINGNFFKVKEDSSSYLSVDANESLVTGLEERTMPSLQLGDRCGSVNTSTCDSYSTMVCYRAMNSEWSYLSAKDEKVYNDRGDTLHFSETLTNFYYENPNHLQLTKTVTTDSRNGTLTTIMHYPLDFTIAAGANDAFTLGVQNLQNKHIINTPVEKYTTKLTYGYGSTMTTSTLTSFDNNQPNPKLAYAVFGSGGFVPASIGGSGLVKSDAYLPLIYFDNYDANNNLIQQHKDQDMNHAYIWDYNGSELVAEVTNAAAAEIAFTSFESDGTGNWVIPTTDRNTGNAITGNKSYTLTGTPITATVPSGKIYTVSYWSNNNALSVNGTTATKGLTKNGWTYYEHVIPAGATTISVAGSGTTIDELRLYPKDAQMATYTYSPLIGTTGTCSTTNVTAYYFYDGLGRLHSIKDWDGNILKTFEYNMTGTVLQ